MTYSRLSDCLLPTLVCLQFCLGMPSPSAAKESKDSEKIPCAADQKLVQRILDASGGGKQTGKKWELNNHWVGDLKAVVRTGGYRDGEHLAPHGKSKPIRLNAMRECFGDGRTESQPPALIIAWGRYSSSSYYFHEHLPSLTDIRDQINVSIESRYTKDGRAGSYRRFRIDSNNIRRSGEIIRDELLRQMELSKGILEP